MKRFIVLIVLCLAIGPVNLFAQAYDGSTDRKMFVGSTMVGDKFGLEIQSDDGLNDLLSYGAKLIFLFSKNEEEYDEFDRISSAFSKFDLVAFFRFHFSETLNLSEKTDPYLGADLSLKALGGHVGFKYNFSETIGMYAQAGHNFSGSFWAATPEHKDGDFMLNRFANKTNISVGFTFNIYSGRGYR